MKLNRQEIADMFGVSKSTVDAWRRLGCPVDREGKKGVAMVFDSVQLLNWFLQQKADKDNDYSSLLQFERYREKKRENDIEERKLANVSILTDALHQSANQIIPILESLPLAIKRSWPDVSGDQIRLVKGEIAKCRNIIASSKLKLE